LNVNAFGRDIFFVPRTILITISCNSRDQFLQHFTQNSFVVTSFQQLLFSYVHVHIEKAAKTTFVEKNCTSNVDEIDSRRVHFIYILQAAFIPTDPESTKKTNNWTVFFVLLVSVRVKAARRMFMKLTP
jgi:hypothetical protein